ncbi:hypothetical protein SDJN03_27300, partial [Cucurbita argyrosperma subsp. sororia]
MAVNRGLGGVANPARLASADSTMRICWPFSSDACSQRTVQISTPILALLFRSFSLPPHTTLPLTTPSLSFSGGRRRGGGGTSLSTARKIAAASAATSADPTFPFSAASRPRWSHRDSLLI